jgi:hypothetical protein
MSEQSAELKPNTPPPKQMLDWQKALIWHGLGFMMLLILTWCDSLFDLMHYFLGHAPRTVNMQEIIIKSGVIVLLWMGSAYKLYLIVSRLSYLESFLHVCAWCRRIQHEDLWLSLEEHFQQRTSAKVSHGICPKCAERFKKDIAAAAAKR